jgi:SAM-dependent methyltransferase
MDDKTLAAYDGAAAEFAADWHAQPPPTDLHAIVRRFFKPGLTADIGCGSGREVAWLEANGYRAVGYDNSEGLLRAARDRYHELTFRHAALPTLADLHDDGFDNVLCETVIMHLPQDEIALAVRRLLAILKPGGILYLSWRVAPGVDQRDASGRLYTAFDPGIVRRELPAPLLLDEEVTSASSGKTIHRIVARKRDAT